MKTKVKELSAELATELQNSEELPLEAPRRVYLPTMSKTDHLLACQWPWGRKLLPELVGEEAIFGSAFHEAMNQPFHRPYRPPFKRIAAKWKVDEKALRDRALPARAALEEWLRDNEHGRNFLDPVQFDLVRERAYAYDVAKQSARECEPHDEEHRYHDRGPTEIPGTVDLAAIPLATGPLLVIDYKSGYSIPYVEDSGQLNIIATALSTLHQVVVNGEPRGNAGREVIIGFLHAAVDAEPIVLSSVLTERHIVEFLFKLRAAQKRIGDGSMRPGDHCAHCPAFAECPTQSTSLVELKRGTGTLTTAEKAVKTYRAIKYFEGLAETLREEIVALCERSGPLTDGEIILDMVDMPRTNLSQASVRRALGKIKGEAELKRLRGLGCIEETTSRQMRSVKD